MVVGVIGKDLSLKKSGRKVSRTSVTQFIHSNGIPSYVEVKLDLGNCKNMDVVESHLQGIFASYFEQ